MCSDVPWQAPRKAKRAEEREGTERRAAELSAYLVSAMAVLCCAGMYFSGGVRLAAASAVMYSDAQGGKQRTTRSHALLISTVVSL